MKARPNFIDDEPLKIALFKLNNQLTPIRIEVSTFTFPHNIFAIINILSWNIESIKVELHMALVADDSDKPPCPLSPD